MTDTEYMRRALELAEQAAAIGEVPVGCVITCDGEIVGAGYNRRETARHALAHAELMAIDEACRTLGGWRLSDCELYVTLEPCPMCAGAILNARIKKVVYAVSDENSGAISKFDMLNNTLNHTTISEHDKTYEEENKNLIQNFFKNKRKNAKK